MYFNGSGENLFCLRKSYKFCSSISNTRHVWFLCWKHSYARTKLNSSAFSWLSLASIDTSIWPWRAYDGWFFRIFIATMSEVPFFQHLTTCPNVPRPKNSNTCKKKAKVKGLVTCGTKTKSNSCSIMYVAHEKRYLNNENIMININDWIRDPLIANMHTQIWPWYFWVLSWVIKEQEKCIIWLKCWRLDIGLKYLSSKTNKSTKNKRKWKKNFVCF